MENKVLKLKNYFLYPFIKYDEVTQTKEVVVNSFQDWLMNQHLHGQASRSRTRFIKIIADRSKEIEEERVEIAKENSKNEKGEVVFIDKAGKVVKENTPDGRYDVKDMNKFIKEWRDYLNEDYLIDVTPANRDIINGVKIILLTTNDEFKGDGAIMYNEWCESFENITDKVEVKKEKKNDK